jgi:hypothetical protein
METSLHPHCWSSHWSCFDFPPSTGGWKFQKPTVPYVFDMIPTSHFVRTGESSHVTRTSSHLLRIRRSGAKTPQHRIQNWGPPSLIGSQNAKPKWPPRFGFDQKLFYRPYRKNKTKWWSEYFTTLKGTSAQQAFRTTMTMTTTTAKRQL